MPSDAKKKRDQAKKLAAKQGKKGKPVQANEEENGSEDPKTTATNGLATENGDEDVEVSQEGNGVLLIARKNFWDKNFERCFSLTLTFFVQNCCVESWNKRLN